MSDGTPLPNRSAETPVSGRDYPEDDPEGRRWSEIWRAAVEELNANALVSDLGANRTDYDPEDGTLFIPTDGGDWYLGTGTGWSNLGPVGDIGDHTSDTTNPHEVTSDQVSAPSDTEFASHTGDATNPHSVTATQADALPTSGGTVTGDTTFTNTTHDSIDTDEIRHGADNTTNLETINIAPGVADVGAAVMSAIDTLSPEGGRIVLPRGRVTLSTQIDLSSGVAGQLRGTPILIEGHGPTNYKSTDERAGTLIDASNLTNHAIVGGDREGLVLKNFGIALTPDGYDSIRMGLSASLRQCEIKNITATGSDFGFNIGNIYGSRIEGLYALGTNRGIRFKDANAGNIRGVVVRATNNVEPAIRFIEGTGFNAQGIYSENNAGGALSISGPARGFSINGLYFEANNSDGSATREIVLGDESLFTGIPNHYTICGWNFASPTNAFGSERFTVDNTDSGEIKSIRGVPNVFTTTSRGGNMQWINDNLGDVDTTNAGGPGYWRGNNITGTINRHSSATVPFGD